MRQTNSYETSKLTDLNRLQSIWFFEGRYDICEHEVKKYHISIIDLISFINYHNKLSNGTFDENHIYNGGGKLSFTDYGGDDDKFPYNLTDDEKETYQNRYNKIFIGEIPDKLTIKNVFIIAHTLRIKQYSGLNVNVDYFDNCAIIYDGYDYDNSYIFISTDEKDLLNIIPNFYRRNENTVDSVSSFIKEETLVTERDDMLINEQDFIYPDGSKGKIAVFIYLGSGDAKYELKGAISKYVGDTPYHILIDANLDNPRMRVVLSDINKMKQEKFDVNRHRLFNNVQDIVGNEDIDDEDYYDDYYEYDEIEEDE